MLILGFPVSARMPVRGIVAAAHVAAVHTHAEVDPGSANTQTVLTTVGGGLGVRKVLDVCTGFSHTGCQSFLICETSVCERPLHRSVANISHTKISASVDAETRCPPVPVNRT